MTPLLHYLRRHHVALLALLVATGGTSYAATQLPRDSVTSFQVKDRTLLGKDFRAGEAPRGERGPRGYQGPTGLTGPVGPLYARAAGTPGADPKPLVAGDLVPAAPLSVSLPATGRLLVTGAVRGTLKCGADEACSGQWGLYVDGRPVPGTAGTFRSGAAGTTVIVTRETFTGVTAVVPAGSHTVGLAFHVLSGGYGAASFPQRNVTAVLVGPS